MAHGYHKLQHWQQWLAHQPAGKHIVSAEQTCFASLLPCPLGRHAGLIGVPQQVSMLALTQLPSQVLITPLPSQQDASIEADLHDLPILSGSLDTLLLPHTLEFVEHPRQLLAEACRIVKPEGLIVISGFNPYSSWQLRKVFRPQSATALPSSNELPAAKIINWLRLADFSIEMNTSLMFLPPAGGQVNQFRSLLEKIGSKWLPFFNGVYVIIARAKVVPLTPIRLKWKQKLDGLTITTTLPGNLARQWESNETCPDFYRWRVPRQSRTWELGSIDALWQP